MTEASNNNSHDHIKQWDEVMVKVIGLQWHNLTQWEKFCEIADLKQYRQQNPNYLSFLIGNSYG